MSFLFSSIGQQVACELNGLLFSPSGLNVGWFVKKAGVFADLNGHYLGEIVCVNRLVYNRCSKYLHVDFGVQKSGGSIGAKVTLRKCGPIQLPPGYEDVNLRRISASA